MGRFTKQSLYWSAYRSARLQPTDYRKDVPGMTIQWSDTQKRRLSELGATAAEANQEFADKTGSNQTYQRLEKKLVRQARAQLNRFRETVRRPGLCRLEARLVEALLHEGFAQVTTPTILAKGLLQKMGIDDNHPLSEQIFWLDHKQCLRPMLAPHLYFVLVDLLRLWEGPVRIFEIGSCFRKESSGAQHSSEFTMLNLVEMALPQDRREQHLESFAATVMKAAGISEYHLESESSEVYGHTVDVVTNKDDIELGSGAMGPHVLDRAWNIDTTWVGIGFGLERLLMVAEQGNSLARYGRSLTYLDGIRLNI